MNYKSWPFKEAEKVLALVQKKGKDYATFQCGFGPSGLPHIGTVAEIIRTRMVIQAFSKITENLNPTTSPESYYQTQLIVFVDDLDALRAAPDTVPNPNDFEQYVGQSVCDIPDPWGTHESFADHNIAKLVELLTIFGVNFSSYELRRASHVYRSGQFNNSISVFAKHADKIKELVTHDYGDDRTNTYCPFLPIQDNKTMFEIPNWKITTLDADGMMYDLGGSNDWHYSSLYDGDIKCQWKVDWPLRWHAFDIDYEMHGKDLLGSAQVGDRIMRALGCTPPIHMMYELFLDQDGKKISKSRGNGLDVRVWHDYCISPALYYYLFQNPRKAKKLYFDIIPQMTDNYLKSLEKYNMEESYFDSPIWFIHNMSVPTAPPLAFSMLLNLVSITNTEDKEIIWQYVKNYSPGIIVENYPILDELIERAIAYYCDKVLPEKAYTTPNSFEIQVLTELKNAIERVMGNNTDNLEEDLTAAIYDVGKEFYEISDLKSFFQMVYQVLMGQTSGPRLPIFVLIFGLQNTINVLNQYIT